MIEVPRCYPDTAVACAKFVQWAMVNGSWEGADIDGGAAQDKAHALGLIVETVYDPKKHGKSDCCDPGDTWYEPSEQLVALISGVAQTPKVPDIEAICHDYAQRWFGEDWPLMEDGQKAELRIEANCWLKCWSALAQGSPDHIEIKRLSALLADAQRIIAEYQASTIAGAKADVAAHGLPGARGQTVFSPGDPVEVRKIDDQIDEIVIRRGDVYVEQLSNDGWFMGVNGCDGSYWQFWFGAKNRKSHVEFRHTETITAEEEARRRSQVTSTHQSAPQLRTSQHAEQQPKGDPAGCGADTFDPSEWEKAIEDRQEAVAHPSTEGQSHD